MCMRSFGGMLVVLPCAAVSLLLLQLMVRKLQHGGPRRRSVSGRINKLGAHVMARLVLPARCFSETWMAYHDNNNNKQNKNGLGMDEKHVQAWHKTSPMSSAQMEL